MMKSSKYDHEFLLDLDNLFAPEISPPEIFFDEGIGAVKKKLENELSLLRAVFRETVDFYAKLLCRDCVSMGEAVRQREIKSIECWIDGRPVQTITDKHGEVRYDYSHTPEAARRVDEWPYSFKNICETLGADPDNARKRLQVIKQAILESGNRKAA